MSQPGCYSLVINLKQRKKIRVGKRGEAEFQPGLYVYTGSAMGGLRARLLRHLSDTKKMRWHIDYFLGYSGFCVKKYSPQRHRVRRDRRIFLIKNSLLRVLRASALKTVADPSFGGSAVQSPNPASQESLKTRFLSDEQASVKRIFLYPSAPGQECRQNQKIAAIRGALCALRNFGASDCNSGCRSHLIFFPRGSRPRIKGIELRLR